MKTLGAKSTKICQLVTLALVASFSPVALAASVGVSISGLYYSPNQIVHIQDGTPTVPDPNSQTSTHAINGNYYVGGFAAKQTSGASLGAVTDANGKFQAFCADLFQSWGLGGPYNYNVTTFGNAANLTAMNQLADYFGQVTNAVTSTAFQLATWEILFEESATFNLGSGDFKASPYSANIANGTAAISQANLWLSTLGQAQDKYSIGFITSPTYQDLVYVTPNAVPLPAALPLMLSGLGVMGFAVRRRRSTV